MKKDAFKDKIERIDSLIRNAQSAEAKKILKTINLSNIQNEYREELADLSRRLNLSYLILKLLDPIVKKDGQYNAKATDNARALYALALSRIGVHNEAENLFKKISIENKKIMLLKASVLLSQWSYRKALVLYNKIYKRNDLTEYEKKIVELNRISCLIATQNYTQAIDEIKIRTHQWVHTAPLLFANSRELLAQAYFLSLDLEKAIETSKESIDLLNQEDDYCLFARKWMIVAESFKSGKISVAWRDFVRKVLQNKDYETLRDLDLFQACLTQDDHLFLKVYKGTSFGEFKKRALKLYRPNFKVTPYCTLEFGNNRDEVLLLINSHSLNLFSQGKQIKLTVQAKKLLSTLLVDFYKPLPLGELFSHLYPNELFDIWSSPHRVYMAVQSLRGQIQNIFKIKIIDKSVSLNLTNCRISYAPGNIVPVDPKLMDWLKQHEAPFKREDIECNFNLSRSKALELIKIGLEQKLLTRELAGRHCLYKRSKKVV